MEEWRGQDETLPQNLSSLSHISDRGRIYSQVPPQATLYEVYTWNFHNAMQVWWCIFNTAILQAYFLLQWEYLFAYNNDQLCKILPFPEILKHVLTRSTVQKGVIILKLYKILSWIFRKQKILKLITQKSPC